MLSHDALARSLADHLRGPDRMAWCDIQLGPSGSPRPDVFTICKSFMRPTPTAYECKVSVSDFRADVTSGKWQAYLNFASGVYFACESGLFGKADVPEHCGLIVLKDGNWRAAKKATLQAVTVPQDALLKLIIDGVEREGPRYRAKAWSESMFYLRMSQEYGEDTATAIRDLVRARHEIEDRRRQAEGILSAAKRGAENIQKESSDTVAPLRAELCSVLELPAGASSWELRAAVARIRQSMKEHPAHASLKQFTDSVRHALLRHGYKDEPVADEVEV